MTTPGRTHIPWQTQTGQIHELINYIGFLEAKVSYLQYHHEHCDAWVSRSPVRDITSPYLPPDLAVSDSEDENQIPLSPTKKSFTNTSFTMAPPKAGSGNPRWKRILDQMTKGWDTPSSWVDKRAAIELDSVEQNKHALTLILGLRNGLPPTWHDCPEPMSSPSEAASRTDALIMSARQYALDTKASQLHAGFVVQVHIFRELVFASLCVVMEQQGLPIDTINDLMRICMSSSGPANLYRLRRGALWVNRVISGTMVRTIGSLLPRFPPSTPCALAAPLIKTSLTSGSPDQENGLGPCLHRVLPPL
jgi:hypothetical protein